MGKLKERYNLSKGAKVGETCRCPSCNTEFIKTSYQQAFCKTKPGSQCKDKYWNTVIPTKRCNTTRISPASARYMAETKRINDFSCIEGYTQSELDKIDREANFGMFDGSWDAHNCYVERCELCGCINCRCDDTYFY